MSASEMLSLIVGLKAIDLKLRCYHVSLNDYDRNTIIEEAEDLTRALITVYEQQHQQYEREMQAQHDETIRHTEALLRRARETGDTWTIDFLGGQAA